MVVEVVEVEEASDGDVLHGGCGEQPEGEREACMVEGMVEEELVPRRGCGSVVRYGYSMGEVVGMEEGMGEGKVLGTVGVGVVVGDSMREDMRVRM